VASGGRSGAQAASALPTTVFWTTDPTVNLPVCTAPGSQGGEQVAAIPDGAGGMFEVWSDFRNASTSGSDLYAQHVLSSGTVDPVWPVNGAPVVTAPGDQGNPVIATDHSGGMIIAWAPPRGGAGIRAQHLLGDGTVDPAWPAMESRSRPKADFRGSSRTVATEPSSPGTISGMPRGLGWPRWTRSEFSSNTC
jgi:hypothetical protein